jgi:hypothetical protein
MADKYVERTELEAKPKEEAKSSGEQSPSAEKPKPKTDSVKQINDD